LKHIPGTKLTLCEQFKFIIEAAKFSIFADRNSPTMTQQEIQDMLDESMNKVLSDSIEPITTKLENLSIKLDTIQQDTASSYNAHLKLSSLFAFRPPPPFSGSIGESLEDFIGRLDHYMILQGVSSTDTDYRVTYLESNLAGAPLAVLRDLKKDPTCVTYDDYIDGLKKFFPDNRFAEIHQQLIHERKQKKNESILEYNNAMRSIAQAAFPDLSEQSRNLIIKPIFLRGLIDEIKNVLKYRDFKSYGELVRSAQFVESQIKKEEIYTPQTSAISAIQAKSHIAGNMADRTRPGVEGLLRDIQATVARIERERTPARVYCRNCGRWGFHHPDACWYRTRTNHFEMPPPGRRPQVARRSFPLNRRWNSRPTPPRSSGNFFQENHRNLENNQFISRNSNLRNQPKPQPHSLQKSYGSSYRSPTNQLSVIEPQKTHTTRFCNYDDENLVSVVTVLRSVENTTTRQATRSGAVMDQPEQSRTTRPVEPNRDLEGIPVLSPITSLDSSDSESSVDELFNDSGSRYLRVATTPGRLLQSPITNFTPASPLPAPRYFFDNDEFWNRMTGTGMMNVTDYLVNIKFYISILELEVVLSKNNPGKFHEKSKALQILKAEKYIFENVTDLEITVVSVNDREIFKIPNSEIKRTQSPAPEPGLGKIVSAKLNDIFLIVLLIIALCSFSGCTSTAIVCPNHYLPGKQLLNLKIPYITSLCNIPPDALSKTYRVNVAVLKLNFSPKYQELHRCYYKKQIVCSAIDPREKHQYNFKIVKINGSDVSTCVKARDEHIDVPNNNFRVIHRNRSQLCYQVSDFFITQGTIVSYDGINVHSNLADLSKCSADKGFCVLTEGTFIWDSDYFRSPCPYQLIGVYRGKFNRGFLITDDQVAYKIGKVYDNCSLLKTTFRTREGVLLQIKFVSENDSTVENVSSFPGNLNISLSKSHESGFHDSKFDIEHFREIYFSSCERRKKRYKTIYNSIKQTALFNPTLAVRMLLRRNNVTATYQNGVFSVQECIHANVSHIFHNYTVNNRCYANLPVLVNEALLFLKPGQSELLYNSTEIPCKNIGEHRDRRLTPNEQFLSQVTEKHGLISSPTTTISMFKFDRDQLRDGLAREPVSKNTLTEQPSKIDFKKKVVKFAKNPLDSFLNFGRKFKNVTKEIFNTTKHIIWKPEIFENSLDLMKNSLKNVTFRVKDKIGALIKNSRIKLKTFMGRQKGHF